MKFFPYNSPFIGIVKGEQNQKINHLIQISLFNLVNRNPITQRCFSENFKNCKHFSANRYFGNDRRTSSRQNILKVAT